MKRLLVLLAGFLLLALAKGQSQPQPGTAQQNTSAQTTPATVRSTSQEVVLDMVFRDKKGRTIHDIRPEEIHVVEDGVEQKVTSFQLVEGKAVGSASTPKTSADSGPLA